MAIKIKLHESAGQFILDCVDTSTGESCVFPDYDITVFDHLVDAKIHLMRICRDFDVTGLHATIYENTPSGKKAVAEYDLSEELPQKMLGESHKPQEGLGFKVPKIRLHENKEPGVIRNKALQTKAIRDMAVLDGIAETPKDVPQDTIDHYMQVMKLVNSQWVLNYLKGGNDLDEEALQQINADVDSGTELDTAVWNSHVLDNDPFMYTFDSNRYGLLNLVWADA